MNQSNPTMPISSPTKAISQAFFNIVCPRDQAFDGRPRDFHLTILPLHFNAKFTNKDNEFLTKYIWGVPKWN